MKFLDGWIYRKVRDMWDNSYKYTHHLDNRKESTLNAPGLALSLIHI